MFMRPAGRFARTSFGAVGQVICRPCARYHVGLDEMKWLHGSCHCKRVQFEVEGSIERVVQCNCSICRKKGALNHAVEPTGFKLISGLADLGTYQFGTLEAKHHFCTTCGIHVFTRPRGAPDLYSVNVRTLDDLEIQPGKPALVLFDGQHWEQAVARIRHEP